MRLTVKRIAALRTPGRYGDGNCLYVVVTPGGSKSWVQRLVIDGRRRDIGLGSCKYVSLAQARDAAYENRRAARRGLDPLAGKRRAKVLTFRQASERALEANKGRWRGSKTAANWASTMAQYVAPVFGDRPVDQIDRGDVLRVLTPIWTAKPELARKVRQRVRATLAWCQAHGYCEHNVAGEGVDGALPSMPAVKSHFRALPYADVAGALAAIDAGGGSLAVRSCLRFVVLTAVRSGEARGARWAEIDTAAATWTIPAERTKMGREHRIPLSAAALAALASVRPLRGEDGLIFPSPARAGQPLSDMSLTRCLRDCGLADRATVHGFRSSFRVWTQEATNVSPDIAEASLGHRVGSAVERSYARSDLYQKRAKLMSKWAKFVVRQGGGIDDHD